MSEYKPPIRINAQDPLCSASAIGNTVIGVLFEKTGAEIKTAITARVVAVTDKITQYESTVQRINDFIEKKRLVLREMDKFQIQRQDELRAFLRPIEREIEDAVRVVQAIARKKSDIVYDFDDETRKDLGKKALAFDEGFDEFQKEFTQLDEFLDKEKEIVQGAAQAAGLPGYQGAQGLQGVTGCQGVSGDSRKYKDVYNACFSSGAFDRPKRDQDDEEVEETAEDKAIARIHTLRHILEKYMTKVAEIRGAIRALKEEKRRLELIGRNLKDDRIYKLDINKLSAFGFENIE